MEPDADVRESDVRPREELVVIDDDAIEILPEVVTEGPSPPSARRVAQPRDGVPLHRFLDRAKPSLAEAAALASLVLDAVAAMHESGCGHGALDSRSVHITAAGSVRLAEWGPDQPFPVGLDDELRRADLDAVAAIVAEITRSAGRPARPLTAAEERLAARLKAGSDPASLRRRGASRAARGLELAIGPTERRQAAADGLAGLARAITAPPPGADGDLARNATAGPAGVPAGHRPATRANPACADGTFGPAADWRPVGGRAPGAPAERRLPAPARRRAVGPRAWKVVAALAVAVLLVGLELVFFGDSVRHNVGALTGAQAKPPVDGPRQPGPMPVLGPPAAGPVTHLELRPLDGCQPGATCNAVVQLTVATQNAPLDVAWGFELVDRCDGRRETRPGGVMTVPPGKDRAVQTVSVPLPAGRALTLVPVTQTPVRVAGVAMPLSARDTTC